MRRLIHILLAGLLVSTAAYAQTPGDTMKDTKQTQTLCLGRFLVDVPRDANIVANPSEYRADKITVTRRVNEGTFHQFILDKEKTLKETKHEKDVSLLKLTSKSSDGNSVSLIYWKEPDSEYIYETEAYKWIKGTQFLLKGNASHDRAPLALDMANRSLAELQYRRDGDIPTTPGFCIDGGFFAGEPEGPHQERNYFHLLLKSHPDVRIQIYTDTNGEKLDENLLARIDGTPIPDFLKEANKRSKVLRRGNHPVGDIQAEEYLKAVPTGETFLTHFFVWEAGGKPRDIHAPSIVVDMKTGKPTLDGYSPPSLTDKQAIELFDSIVNSIRVRPTGEAAEPTKPVPPPTAQSKAPLGTTLASGARCPQSGLWVCDRPDALGGNRRFISEGETLSSVLVPVERSLLAKLRNTSANQEAKTTWTLESLVENKTRS